MSGILDGIRLRIEALGMGFKFLAKIQTGMNGIERETWLLEYEGSQFVFVAGRKNVILGWDHNCSLPEGLRNEFESGHEHYLDEIEELKSDYQEDILKAKSPAEADGLRAELAEELEAVKEEMDEGGYSSWEDFMAKWNGYLSQCMSPLRKANIGDMLVEVDSRYLEENAPSLAEAVRSLKEGPFTLATEDEWEYLCNGGARTLFRWGGSLDGVVEAIYQVGAVSKSKEPAESLLERPNMFGLFIAYDSYKNEIIDSLSYTKGGDGGRSLCGGDGPIYVLPCYTAFYRNSVFCAELSKNYYCYRRIIRLPG